MSSNRIFAALIVILLGIASSVPSLAYAGNQSRSHAHGGKHYRSHAHGGYHYRSHVHGGSHSWSHAHFGFYFGAPAFWHYPSPYYYYPPAYYYPPVGVEPASPATYVERGDARAGREQAQDYWYYCPESQAYYPYVKQCAKGWQKVPPQPQN
ncbi:MAG TPA: hypothetical protein VFR39_03995 [Burkholderiales bacterium]|nr:hypothetical protein [Burkholderiales bacterium]